MLPALKTPSHPTPAIYGRPAKAGQVFEFRFGRGERRVIKKRRKVRPSVWAEEYRVLTMSSMPGPWKNATTPYLAGIMDASFHPSVRMVIVCAAPQTGKTEAIYNCVGYAADCDPGPAMVVMPDEITARDNSNDRIQPMFSSSTRLSRYLTGRKDDANSLRINLRHMPIYMAWARSVSRLANRPCRYGAADEVDKYPVFANAKEAGPIDLLKKRLITYRRTSKLWLSSTPTIESGPIWQAILVEAQVVFDYLAVCPACRREQVMSFQQIKWGESRDPEEVEHKLLAKYECRHCGAMWDDFARDTAVRAGCWRARITTPDTSAELALAPHQADHGDELYAYLARYNPGKIAFHVPSKISPFVSLSQDAAAFLRGQKDKSKLRDWRNAHEALPWVHYEQVRREDTILALRDDRPRGIVPAGGLVQKLTAGVDTQDDGFWYSVFAWGWSGEDMTIPGWEVRSGFALTFADLSRALWDDSLVDADGTRYAVSLVLQDAGGHRTAEVYDFARRNPGKIVPTFGRDTMAVPHNWSAVQYYPGKKKPIPGGLRILNVNTKFYKDELARRLAIDPGDSGALRLCAEFRDDYARHYTAEHLNDRGLWECPPGKANHLWDCAVLALTAADVMDLKFRRRPTVKKAPPETPQTPPTPIAAAIKQRSTARRRPAGGWMAIG